MRLVLDTSIIIDYLRDGKIGVAFFNEEQEDITFYLPTIVIFELLSGQSTKIPTKLKIINEFLKYFQRIELTESIAERAGKIYRDITAKLEVPDYIIAASALEIGGTVVTLNTKHFQQIPG
ncbi:TPA: VapC toxin family PIN domain ribonuclease, partial [Candidatus Daviesbacteria bacterium]